MNEWGPTVGIGPLIFFSPTAIFYETSFKKVSQRLPKLLHKYPYPLFYCFMLCFSISFILGRCDTFVLQSCRVQTVEINIIITLWRYYLYNYFTTKTQITYLLLNIIIRYICPCPTNLQYLSSIFFVLYQPNLECKILCLPLDLLFWQITIFIKVLIA